MTKNEIKIGQKVFIINKDCEIEEKEVFAIINSGKEVGYTLDENSCGGYFDKDVFTTKPKAEVEIQNFMDKINFKKGDLIVFEYKDYSNKKKAIGRIMGIKHSSSPYEIRGSFKEFDSISEDQILLKVKNEFIENYGDIQELYRQFEEKEKEVRDIINMIHNEFDNLETEINDSVRKKYGFFNWNKSKPIFKDRFTYQEARDYYD